MPVALDRHDLPRPEEELRVSESNEISNTLATTIAPGPAPQGTGIEN